MDPQDKKGIPSMLAKVQKIVHVMLGTKSEAPEFKTKQRLGFVHFISKPP